MAVKRELLTLQKKQEKSAEVTKELSDTNAAIQADNELREKKIADMHRDHQKLF